MNYPVLEEVVGQAIIDRDFCAGLLSRFSLSPEETQVLMGIRADSLEAFAGQLHRWIESQQPARRRLHLA